MSRRNISILGQICQGVAAFFCEPAAPSSTYLEVMHKDRDFVLHKILVFVIISSSIESVYRFVRVIIDPSTGLANGVSSLVAAMLVMVTICALRCRERWNMRFFRTFDIILMLLWTLYSVGFFFSFDPVANPFAAIHHTLGFACVVLVLNNRMTQVLALGGLLPILIRTFPYCKWLDNMIRVEMALMFIGYAVLNRFSFARSMQIFSKSYAENEEKAFLLEQMHEAILVYDENDKLTFRNTAVKTVLLEGTSNVPIHDLNEFRAFLQSQIGRLTSLEVMDAFTEEELVPLFLLNVTYFSQNEQEI